MLFGWFWRIVGIIVLSGRRFVRLLMVLVVRLSLFVGGCVRLRRIRVWGLVCLWMSGPSCGSCGGSVGSCGGLMRFCGKRLHISPRRSSTADFGDDYFC